MGYDSYECWLCYNAGRGNNAVGSDDKYRHPVCLICIADSYGEDSSASYRVIRPFGNTFEACNSDCILCERKQTFCFNVTLCTEHSNGASPPPKEYVYEE
jgi:hypothetical protein